MEMDWINDVGDVGESVLAPALSKVLGGRGWTKDHRSKNRTIFRIGREILESPTETGTSLS